MGALDKLFGLISPTYEKATTREEDMTNLYNQLSTDNEEQSIEKQLEIQNNREFVEDNIPIGSVDSEATRGVAITDDSRNPSVLNEQIYTPNLNQKTIPGLTSLLDKEKKKPVPTLPTEGQEKNKFEPKPGQIIPDFSSREPAVTEEPKAKEKSITSQSDFIVDDYFLNHFKNNEDIKKTLGPGAEGGTTKDIGYGHKLLGDEITTKKVYGIDVSEGVTDKQSDTIARLDIQGERGVNRAIKEFNKTMKENNIKKNFKDLEKWKQNLLIDFSLNNAPAKNLAKALANNNITDIVENATDRTFKQKNNKGVLVRKYLSKRNEDTYKNLIEPFIKDSVSEEKLKYYLEEVLKRKGFYNRKKHNKIIEKQSGGMIESDPYKREPRFI